MPQDPQPAESTVLPDGVRKPPHDTSLDLLKGILVLGMVAAHIVQFFPSGGSASAGFSNYINLITFSGFMFVFGCTCSIAYLFKDIPYPALAKKLSRGFVRTLVAFYISGIAFAFFVAGECTPASIIRILTLQYIPGYSEFLLSFAFIFPFLFAVKPLANRLNGLSCIILVILSLFSCSLQFDTSFLPALGVFIGGNTFFCFPILSYVSYFVAGAYLSKKKESLNWMVLITACAGTLAFCMFAWQAQALPNRFPPSALWVMGGYLFVYAYWLACRKVKRWNIVRAAEAVGAKSLQYLVASNVSIFLAFWLLSQTGLGLGGTPLVVFWVLLFAACMAASFACVKVGRWFKGTFRTWRIQMQGEDIPSEGM